MQLLHDRMTTHDRDGTSYWLENIYLTNGRMIAKADVQGHTASVLVLFSATQPTFVNMAHLVCADLVTD
jgi:hypothetical protein